MSTDTKDIDAYIDALKKLKEKETQTKQSQVQTSTLSEAQALETETLNFLKNIVAKEQQKDTQPVDLITKKVAAEQIIPYLKIIQIATIIGAVLPIITLFLGTMHYDVPAMGIVIVVVIYLAICLRKASSMINYLSHKYQIQMKPSVFTNMMQNKMMQQQNQMGNDYKPPRNQI